MTEDVYVLVKFMGLHHTPYNIVTLDHWNIYSQGITERSQFISWQEVARGAFKEMVALAHLMPDPKRLHFD